MAWVNADRAGRAARRALRAVRHRALADLRRHALRQPGPRRPRVLAAYLALSSLGHASAATTGCRCSLVVVPVMAVHRLRRRSARCSTARSARIRCRASWSRFGLGIVIQNALLEHYTADRQEHRSRRHPHEVDQAQRRHRRSGWFPLITFVVAVVVLAGPAAVLLPHPAGPRVPGHRRRSRDRAADGHRLPPRLRPGDGDRLRRRGAGRVLPATRTPFAPCRRPLAAVRVRGGGHRRTRLAVGHVARRRSCSASPRASGNQAPSAAACSSATSCSCRARVPPARPARRSADTMTPPASSGAVAAARRIGTAVGTSLSPPCSCWPVAAVGEREHAAHARRDALLPVAGPDVEPARRLRGSGLGRAAGLRGRRRLHDVRASPSSTASTRSCPSSSPACSSPRCRCRSRCSRSGSRAATSRSAPG